MSGKKKLVLDTNRVGYGKPPVHSRFRKGQSGNPTGGRRPNEAKRSKEIMEQEAFRLLTIREGDTVTRMPALQAVLRSQIARAVKGNVSAQRAVVKAIQDIESAEERAPTAREFANMKTNKDINDMTDKELMKILRAAQNDQLG